MQRINLIFKKGLCYFLHLPQNICIHVMGKNHTTKHRAVAGFGCVGVGMLCTSLLQGTYFHFITEAIGLCFYGIGTAPITDHITLVADNAEKKQQSIINKNTEK